MIDGNLEKRRLYVPGRLPAVAFGAIVQRDLFEQAAHGMAPWSGIEVAEDDVGGDRVGGEPGAGLSQRGIAKGAAGGVHGRWRVHAEEQ